MTEPTPIRPAAGFEPARHLSRISGSDYLEVKWRLVWLRDRHPDATVATELIEHEPGKSAVFKAAVQTGSGGGATGYGMETAGDFRDYLEKAETKAIGRALAALGFGTQFCSDHDFGSDRGRVVDSPVNLTRHQRTEAPNPEGVSAAPDQQATQRQYRYLQAVARENGITPEELERRAQADYNTPSAAQLSRRDASALIQAIETEAGKRKPSRANPQIPSRADVGDDGNVDRSPTVLPYHITDLHKAAALAFPTSRGEELHLRVKGQALARFGRRSLNDLTQRECGALVGYLSSGNLVDEIADTGQPGA